MKLSYKGRILRFTKSEAVKAIDKLMAQVNQLKLKKIEKHKEK